MCNAAFLSCFPSFLPVDVHQNMGRCLKKLIASYTQPTTPSLARAKQFNHIHATAPHPMNKLAFQGKWYVLLQEDPSLKSAPERHQTLAMRQNSGSTQQLQSGPNRLPSPP